LLGPLRPKFKISVRSVKYDPLEYPELCNISIYVYVCMYVVRTCVCIMYVCMYVCMIFLRVGVIHISFQGCLSMTYDYMKVISEGFKSSHIAMYFHGLYLSQVMRACCSLAAVKPSVKYFANTSLLPTKHLLHLTTPQNKEPGDRGG
jgi:hypothetical protein